jgi:hypothetical protein
MEAQRAGFVQSRNAAIVQIRFHESPGDRLRHRKEPSRRLRRSRRRRRMSDLRHGCRIGPWQAEKASCFVGDIAEIEKAAALADDVEQVTMLAGGGIGLMFNCT